MIILDVRSKREFDAGHVPGARHLPFWAVLAEAPRLSIDADAPITVYCGHGPRAWVAKAALRARGFSKVRLLAGHMRRWKREGRPLE
ncbi:MAG: rhodanese-like domain-containing protein [Vicinamibacterales bacterium]